jgi:hypothetical protein
MLVDCYKIRSHEINNNIEANGDLPGNPPHYIL